MSQIHASIAPDRTCRQTRTLSDHDPRFKRHGTTTLFAALSVLDGTVIGRCVQRHRQSEFTRFLNAVETLFSKMTRQRIHRDIFRSIADLQATINAYLAEHNASPKPFAWTRSAEAILAKLDRCHVASV
jgi:hypothetical protein